MRAAGPVAAESEHETDEADSDQRDPDRLQAWIGFINSEIHKTFGPLFNPQITAEAKQQVFERLRGRFGFVDKDLAGRPFLLGEQFTVADAYLFVMLNWCDHIQLDFSNLRNLKALQQRVASRPAVQAALKAEGLLH